LHNKLYLHINQALAFTTINRMVVAIPDSRKESVWSNIEIRF